MRCEDCLRRLDGLSEGLLDEGDARRTRAHLAACHACSEAWEEIEREQELYGDYWREAQIAPPRWEAVLARVESERAAREAAPRPFARLPVLSWPAPLARSLAAAVLLAALAAGLFTIGRLARRYPSHAPEAAARGDVADPVRTSGVAPEAAQVARKSDAAETPSAEAGPRPPAPQGVIATARRERDGVPRASKAAATRASSAAASESAAVARGAAGAPVPAADVRFKEAAALSELVSAARRPAAAGRSPQIEAEVARHCERTQMLFLSMKNTTPGARAAADLAYERGLARRLLNRNALLRREVESQGGMPLAELLDDVAPVLAEIANLSPQSAQTDVLSINERVRRRGLIALLKTYSAGAGEVASRGAY
jgi:hypothetical protein